MFVWRYSNRMAGKVILPGRIFGPIQVVSAARKKNRPGGAVRHWVGQLQGHDGLRMAALPFVVIPVYLNLVTVLALVETKTDEGIL